VSAQFSTLSFSLNQLTNLIDDGSIGLPEIQRPFVWKRTKVRDLFDSMYRGFPVGYFLFWRNASSGAKQIGVKTHQLACDRMIVDGQQRLTSLYAVMRGATVIDENYRETRIEIGFNPVDGSFAVTSAAHRKDRQWIPDISALWQPNTDIFSFVGNYVARLREDRDVGAEEEREIGQRVNRLLNLHHYNFTAIELSAETEPEEVADIFVRINSAGVELNQADFILTLMSVYWDEGRKQLEAFSRAAKQPSPGKPSPFNYILDPSPDQLLRVAIGYGFRRGRLKAVYNLLRGKDLDSDGITASERNFAMLKAAQAEVINLANWHQFLQCVMFAGFRSGRLITAANTLLYSYVLFLIGKRDFAVAPKQLRPLIAKWLFMSALTSRYSGSYESQIESDLNRLAGVSGADAFADTLERIMAETLTDDYWSIQLPSELETTAARSPTLYAYYAALSLLRARVLFSPMTVSELLDPAVRGDRLAVERHHLFPVAYLKSIGIDASREVDQIANYAVVEWPENAAIGALPPHQYAPPLMASLAPAERQRMMQWHALPEGWESMAYPEFLAARRKRIADVVRLAFASIGAAPEVEKPSKPKTLAELIAAGENSTVEFKSTARWSIRDGKVHEGVEFAVVRTIAGFMNTAGGTLVIGIDDDGVTVGLEHDYQTLRKKDRDGFELWITDLLQVTLGKNALTCVMVSFEKLDSKDVARIEVQRSRRIVFVNPPTGPRVDDVFVRFGNSTRKLTPAELLEYNHEWSREPQQRDEVTVDEDAEPATQPAAEPAELGSG
jgi:hypothetical protein